ncbi:MAG: ankyrin repeat domain-containing protein [Verrucomicrobiales bacterium]
MKINTLARIADGRTDLVFDYIFSGNPATSIDEAGVPLIKWCAYYGDVSAIKFLLANGEALESLGRNLDLNGAAFHGHWQLCQYLIENGAGINEPLKDTGESPLHAALCTSDRSTQDFVVKILLAHGADPNCVTLESAETGCFMRDCRTKGETPLHRAAAFGSEDTIDMLLAAGARVDAKDMHGDSPLSWASWHLRPKAILQKLCYGDFHIRPNRRTMAANLRGEPHA